VNPALRAAYGRTAYEAAGAVARIGRRSAAVDAVLRRLGARRGAFVTAWNPFSRRMPPGWNGRMLARLREAARRLPMEEGTGRGRGWAERHLLVAADPRRVAALARRFRQNAVVAVRVGGPARLVEVSSVRGGGAGSRSGAAQVEGWAPPSRRRQKGGAGARSCAPAGWGGDATRLPRAQG
jgi:hypothetical protein